jgi:hypothetical protein
LVQFLSLSSLALTLRGECLRHPKPLYLVVLTALAWIAIELPLLAGNQ